MQSTVSSGGGAFALGAARTFTVNDGPAENDLVLDAPITGGAGDTLIKDGAGVMVMGGFFANTSTGATIVRNGRLNLNKTGSNPAIAGALIIGDDVGAANSAVVRLTVANQITNTSDVEVKTDGLLDMNSLVDTFALLDVNGGAVHVGPVSDLTTGAITMNGGTIAIGATASLLLTNNIQVTSTAAQTAVINGAGTLHLNGGTRGINVRMARRRSTCASTPTSRALAAESVAKIGPGVALLTGTGTYTGQTNVIGDGTLLVNGTLNPTGFVLAHELPPPRSAAPATSARSPSAPAASRQDSAQGSSPRTAWSSAPASRW